LDQAANEYNLEQDDKADELRQALPKLDKKGDATYAIRELSKDRPVDSKAIPIPNRTKSKIPDNGVSK
jgi:hypothetical protein